MLLRQMLEDLGRRAKCVSLCTRAATWSDETTRQSHKLLALTVYGLAMLIASVVVSPPKTPCARALLSREFY